MSHRDRKRILYFQQDNCYGATESYISTLAEYFKDKFNVAVIYPDISSLEPFGNISGVMSLPLMKGKFSGSLIQNAYPITRAIRSFNPDIGHCNDPSLVGIITSKLASAQNIVVTHHTSELNIKYGWKGTIAKKFAFKLADFFIFTSGHD